VRSREKPTNDEFRHKIGFHRQNSSFIVIFRAFSPANIVISRHRGRLGRAAGFRQFSTAPPREIFWPGRPLPRFALTFVNFRQLS
jgi:hypothetical protein